MILQDSLGRTAVGGKAEPRPCAAGAVGATRRNRQTAPVSSIELPYPSAPGPSRVRDDLLTFLRHPRPEVPTGPLPDLVWAKLLALQFLSLVLAAPFLAAGFALVSEEQYTADEGVPAWAILLLAVIAAPLIEETAFRLALTRFQGGYLILGGVCLAAVSAGAPPPVLPLLLLLAGAVVVLGVAGLWSPATQERLGGWWERRFPLLFYFSALLFGLIHLSNYDLGTIGVVDALAAPLLVSAQLLGGLLLGYCRVRLGIFAAMGQHAAYNGLLVGFALLAGGL